VPSVPSHSIQECTLHCTEAPAQPLAFSYQQWKQLKIIYHFWSYRKRKKKSSATRLLLFV